MHFGMSSTPHTNPPSHTLHYHTHHHTHYTGQRPSKWIHKNDPTFLADPQPSVADSISAHVFNFIIIDKIIYLSQQLKVLNESVRVLQIATFHQRQIVDEQETERQQNVHGKIEAHATLVAGKFLSSNVKSFQSVTQKMTEMFRLVGASILPAPVIADAGIATCIRTYMPHVHLNTDMSTYACKNTHKHAHLDLHAFSCIVDIYVDAAENGRELLNGEEEGADYDVGVSSSNISVSTPESLRFSRTYCFTSLHSTILHSVVLSTLFYATLFCAS